MQSEGQASALVALALDGLSGAGKSTVGRRVAERCGWGYLDTGASYRAMTLAALQAGAVVVGADAVDEGSTADIVAVVARALPMLDLSTDPRRRRVLLAGVDRSREIRDADVTATVSAVSAVPGVRLLLAAWQRAQVLASAGTVAEGRDIGTVVLPDAPLKVWLTADLAARAARRLTDVATFGGVVDADASAGRLAAVRASVDRRDALDTARTTDPARPADDAVVVDTTGLDVVAVVDVLIELLIRRGLLLPASVSAPDAGR